MSKKKEISEQKAPENPPVTQWVYDPGKLDSFLSVKQDLRLLYQSVRDSTEQGKPTLLEAILLSILDRAMNNLEHADPRFQAEDIF